jgi:hypothetical protein
MNPRSETCSNNEEPVTLRQGQNKERFASIRVIVVEILILCAAATLTVLLQEVRDALKGLIERR